jgi:hypothetical protein
MEVMFDVGPGVKRNAGAVHSMSLQAQERRTLSAKCGKVHAHARHRNMCECRMCCILWGHKVLLHNDLKVQYACMSMMQNGVVQERSNPCPNQVLLGALNIRC